MINLDNGTKICALVPTFNEGQVIEGTLRALLDAGLPAGDIYVVDDCSTDDTVQQARALGVNVFTVPQNGGKAAAQRAALAHWQLTKRYDWVTLLDGDTLVDREFFNEMRIATENDPTTALFVGQVKNIEGPSIFSASRAFDYTYGHDIAKVGQSNFNVIFVSPGCASLYRSDVLEQLDIDSSTLAEDMDLTMQVHRRREKVKYLPQAVVNTQDPATFKDYHKQVLRWYRGFWQVIRKHRVFGLTRKRPVDLYMALLTADALLFNRIVWFIGFLLFASRLVPLAVAIDLTVSGVICLWAAYRTRRVDVIYKFPAYYWMSYVNFYAYLRAFVEVIVLRRTLLSWNKVARYSF
jgi:cellulose synthase/poly-beta-1,6-N-acetylglucosamine synthase-like glycosyltransferase